MRMAIGFLAAVLAISSIGQASAREWTSSNGKFTIDAEFVAVKNDKVVLEKPDGTYLSVPLNKLSPEDIEFIEAETGESLEMPGEDDADSGDEPAAGDEGDELASASTPRAGGPRMVKLKGERPDDPPGEARKFSDLRWGAKSLAFSPNGGLLAVGKKDDALLIFDVSEGTQKDFHEKLRLLGDVSASAFTPDGRTLLTGGREGLIGIWSVSAGGVAKEAGQFVGHVKEVIAISISRDSKFAISVGQDGRICYWQISNGKELAAFNDLKRPKSCHLSADGRTAWATDGTQVLKIDLKQERVTPTTLPGRLGGSGQFAAFSADSRLLAIGEHYGVRLWDLRAEKELPQLEESEIQWSGAFTPDGTRLVTGGSGKVNVWDVKSQRRMAVLSSGDTGYVQSVATSPDNWHAAAACGPLGGEVVVFRLPKE